MADNGKIETPVKACHIFEEMLPFDCGYRFKDLKDCGLHRRTNDRCHLIKKGLLSGKRSTDFVNSILNKIQTDIVVEDVSILLGLPFPIMIDKKHKGDDIEGFLTDWTSGVAFNTVMRMYGMVG